MSAKKQITIYIFLFLLLVSCSGEISVVGVKTNKNEEIETKIPNSDFKQNLQNRLEDLQETVLFVVDSDKARKVHQLRTIVVGFDIDGEIGAANILGIGGDVGISIIFSNKSDKSTLE